MDLFSFDFGKNLFRGIFNVDKEVLFLRRDLVQYLGKYCTMPFFPDFSNEAYFNLSPSLFVEVRIVRFHF